MWRTSEIGSGGLQSPIASRDKTGQRSLGWVWEPAFLFSLPPSSPPQLRKCKSSEIVLSDSFAVLSENSDFRNSDPMLVYDFIFIPLVLMEDDTYNLFKSFVLEYLLSGSTF